MRKSATTLIVNFVCLLFTTQVRSQVTYGTTQFGTNGGGSINAPCSEILEFSGYNDQTAATGAGQNFGFPLGDGDTLFFTLLRIGGSMNAVTTPSWIGSALGNNGYNGLTGQDVLYQANNGTSATLQFNNVRVKSRFGMLVPNYTVLVYDGESTNQYETIDITSPTGYNWFFWDTIAPSNNYLVPALNGLGTNHIQMVGSIYPSTYNLAEAVAVNSPPSFTISLNLTSTGFEGVVIGIQRTIVSRPDTVCSGGSINILPVNAPAGTTYTWNAPVATPPGSITGGTAQSTPVTTITQNLTNTTSSAASIIYTITPSACGGTTGIPFQDTIVFIPSSTTFSLGNDTTLCAGQTLTLNSSIPGATYHWQDNSTNSTYQVTTAGTYSVTITASGGCLLTSSINITYSPSPSLNLGHDTSICPGQTVVLNATTANATYRWQDNSTASTYTATSAGTYSVTVTNPAGCSTTDVLIVSNFNLNSINLGNDTTLCTGQTLTLDATTPGGTYHWQDNSMAASYVVTVAGTYSVTVTNSGGCTVSASINVSYSTLPPAFGLGNDTSFCPPFSATLNSGNINTLWSTGVTAAQINISTAGTFWAQQSNGCGTTRDTIQISVLSTAQVTISGEKPVCTGDSVLLIANGSATSFNWSTGATSSAIYVYAPGIYWVDGSTNSVCPAVRDSATIPNGHAPYVILGPDTNLCSSDGLTLKLHVPYSTYMWQDGTTDSSYRVFSSGNYSVTVTNSCGTSSASRNINIYPDECRLHIPTAFSPNDDGANDVFRVHCKCPVQRFLIKIYNRWGEQVFTSNNINDGWDGTYKGRSAEMSVYVYYLEYFNHCEGEMEHQSGNITLIR